MVCFCISVVMATCEVAAELSKSALNPSTSDCLTMIEGLNKVRRMRWRVGTAQAEHCIRDYALCGGEALFVFSTSAAWP